MAHWKTPATFILCTLASLSSLLLSLALYDLVTEPFIVNPKSGQFLAARSTDISKYSLIGDDFPHFLPLKTTPPVLLAVEESVHYSLTDAEAEDEWLYNSPWGTGGYRLGPEHRGFFAAMFHELHCLRKMRSYFTDSDPDVEHVQHCLNYLREMILCQADTTLEPGNFMKRNFTEQRSSVTYVCRDWEAVYDEVGLNWLKWNRYIKQANFSASEFTT